MAEAVAEWATSRYPAVRIAGVRDGYFTEEETDEVIRHIHESRADVLLVALGAPRQEFWIDHHLVATGVPVALGVGGLFDFYSGRLKRAPLWMREAGIEWLYRLIQEPRRMWKRYLIGNLVFVFRVWIYGCQECRKK